MFDKIQNGDKIISELSDDDITKYQKLCGQFETFEHYKHKMSRAFNKFQAMQVLFWEDMIGKYERCESATYRGKILSACKVDDKCVIVERTVKEEDDKKD